MANARQNLIALIAEVPDEKLEQVSVAVGAALAGESVTRPAPIVQNGKQRRFKNGKLKLPALPTHLRWPTKKYSVEHRKRGIGIVQFLENEWRPLIEVGFGELRWLRLIDISAINAVNYFERADPETGVKNLLPAHLRFRTEKEVTNHKLARGLEIAIRSDPRLASAIASRVRRGTNVPTL